MGHRLIDRLRERKPQPPHTPQTPMTGMSQEGGAAARIAVQPDPNKTRDRTKSAPPPWALRMMRKRVWRRLLSFVAAIIGLCLVVGVLGVTVNRGSSGTVGVVRNGGPLDTRGIRQIITVGQHLTYTGLFSQKQRIYPAPHVTLKYTITSRAPKKPQAAVDTIHLPTQDGVLVGIDGAVFFSFVGDDNLHDLRAFDNDIGTRRFPTPDGRLLYPWQGDEGFNSMLDTLFRPVLENDLRVEIGSFACASLVSSCALLDTDNAKAATTPSVNIAEIERRINGSLERDLQGVFGHRYFFNVRFRVEQVRLPTNVQAAVDDAAEQFAAVNTQLAELRQARYRAKRNRLLGKSYNKSPGLTTIEALKAIPEGSTVIFSTGGRAPSILASQGTTGPTTAAGGKPATGGDSAPGAGDDTAPGSGTGD